MKHIRIAMAQINSVVGDLEGNTSRIITSIEQARDQGADIVVFPELAITGYPPGRSSSEKGIRKEKYRMQGQDSRSHVRYYCHCRFC